MIENLIKDLRAIINKKIDAQDLDEMIANFDRNLEPIEDHLFRIDILKDNQKVLSIDYSANIFNETVVVKKISEW
ncbi:hypothetical protein ACV3R4_15065 [Clostridium perfringens]|nr:hypothetical protein [Clostridium perfringens]MDK0928676.1 hypothetical protein [Clostridium perfringens]MDK0934457.1 hypothetical protein [Clostridium perfringens]MDK0957636.1 hypothetical protein [Clostridium perfringens]MDK0960512.1 hypothetical protein [Clostridium perfringens]